MKVDQIMTQQPVYISGKARAHEALTYANGQGVHYLLVVDGEEDLIGITCLCDVARAPVNDAVSTFAHTPVTYVMEGESAQEAARIMHDCAIGCLPVLRNPGEVVGVLTRHDLRDAGVLRELVHCASCGASHGLVDAGGGVPFCRACLESTPPPGTVGRRWYCTLGAGD